MNGVIIWLFFIIVGFAVGVLGGVLGAGLTRRKKVVTLGFTWLREREERK